MTSIFNLRNHAQQRYLARFFSAMSAYVLFFALAQYTFHHYHPLGSLAVMLALGPAVAIVASMIVVGIYLTEEQDEFARMVFIRSILWGIAGTLGFTTVRGFLELFLGISPFPLYAIYPVFWVVNGLAQAAHEFYYRRAR